MSVTDLRAEREKLGLPPGGPNGRSLAERAGDDLDLPEHNGELFPKGMIEGDERTIQNLIQGNLPVEVTVSLMSAEVPSRTGGLLDPDQEGHLVVTHEASKYLLIPQREGEPGDKRIVGWKVRQQIRPTYVERKKLYTREQVEDMFLALGVPPSSDKALELLAE